MEPSELGNTGPMIALSLVSFAAVATLFARAQSKEDVTHRVG